ncbi:MAG: hypothetical protein N2Z63_08420 [Thiobacillaceae bacterium]|nr:hypothetical protein [Thiobacillaceae bacterium]
MPTSMDPTAPTLQEPSGITPEMEGWRVTSFADVLRALQAHPDWLQRLRELILTTELLELPRKMAELLRRVEKIEGVV